MAENKRELVRTFAAAQLCYLGFRLLGASKKHAWERAKTAVVKAILDKVVEATGIRHPDGVPEGSMQITFEGGPADREVRVVEICGTVDVKRDDGAVYRYGRTDRVRGQSIIFTLEKVVA